MGLTFAGGTDTTPGWGDHWLITFAGTWTRNETWTVTITSTVGDATLGQGRVAVVYTVGPPTCCGVLGNRVYVGFPSFYAFSETGGATGWDIQAAGAGTVPWLSQRGQQDAIIALASFQGRLVVFGRYSIQIWSVDADPALFSRAQTLENIGALSPLCVQSVGDLDVLFLDDTGIRSLRSRETTLNAVSTDVGTPIDTFVQAGVLAGGGPTSCSVVEPLAKRFWLFLQDTIYVLSQFPASKISAWSTYKPTYNVAGTQTAFTPKKFVVYNGSVYCRGTVGGTDRLFLYGGTNRNTYDACIATVELPYLDDKKATVNKVAQGISVAATGSWVIYAGMNPATGTLTEVHQTVPSGSNPPDTGRDSSFDIGHIGYSEQGTHFKLKAVTEAKAEAAKLHLLGFSYNQADDV